MKKNKFLRTLRCAVAAVSIPLMTGVGSAQTDKASTTLDPMHDGLGIVIWGFYNSNYPHDTFQTFGDFNFQTTEHGVLFAGAFNGNATALTNMPTTSLTVVTNAAPPGNTTTPVGWFSITDTNGISYRVPIYR